MARAVTLTVYLVKKGYSRAQDILRVDGHVRRYELMIGQRPAWLHVRPPAGHPPGWLVLFEGVLDLKLITANAAAVLLLRVHRRQFALTFGYGRALLNPSAYEEQFGLSIISAGTVSPNWADAQLIAKYKASGPEQVLKKILLPGEIAKISDIILDLSGYGDDAVGEVKNESTPED